MAARVDELEQVHPERPTIFPVAPVRAGSRVPRLVVIAVAVGVVAFLAGIRVGAARPALPSPLPPSSAPVPAATALPAFDPPGSSAFARTFRPSELIAGLAHGAGCVTSSGQKVVPRTRQDGSRLTFVQHWMTFCPLEEVRRQTFLLAVIDALVREVPSETYGHSTSDLGAGDALFPYAQYPYVGTVTLSAHAAGPGFEIVIILEERLAS